MRFGAEHTGEFLHDKVGECGVRNDDPFLTHGEFGEGGDVAKGMDADARTRIGVERTQ